MKGGKHAYLFWVDLNWLHHKRLKSWTDWMTLGSKMLALRDIDRFAKISAVNVWVWL